jgi:hypothetical protein
MPYKNPERKRQWEREHRGQRENAAPQSGVGTPGYSKTSAPSCFRSKSANYMEDYAWLGDRDRGRAACGIRRSRLSPTVNGTALDS